MNSQQAKMIKIADYLQSIGIKPVKIQNENYWYYSPFRNEKTASFKVNNILNVWSDYGSGKKGNILDLVMSMHNIQTISGALAHLSGKAIQTTQNDSFSFRQQNITQDLKIINVHPISNSLLIEYVKSRKIDLELAQKYCCEIHYQVKGNTYFSIGFKNDRGGYEHSNPIPFKGSTHPKDITTFKNPNNNFETCLAFEGFWDFLSFLKLKNLRETQHNVVVLNSVANLPKAIDFIKQHEKVYTYFDNDETGKKATQQIKNMCKYHSDQSENYRNHKDLNDFLKDFRTEKKQNINKHRLNKK